MREQLMKQKTNFELWADSFRTTGQELWRINPSLRSNHPIRLYETKRRIVSGVNENPFGPRPIFHVWNVAEDKSLYCGLDLSAAYTIYRSAKKQYDKEHQNNGN